LILMGRAIPLFIAVCMLFGAAAPAQDPAPEQQERLDAMQSEIERLKLEVDTLRAENLALKARLAAAEQAAATRPATTRASDVPFTLGDEATLGVYKYRTPGGWTFTGVKDNKLGALYRSPDKAGVIYVQVRIKGAVPPDIQSRYGQSIVQKLKEDFLKNKVEVLDPPAVVKDPRFFLKVHERIKVKTEKSEKTADQTHLYLMPGKDMIELSVISTGLSPEATANVQKIAEEMLVTFTPSK